MVLEGVQRRENKKILEEIQALVKFPFFVDDVVVYTEDLKISIKKAMETTKCFHQVAGCKHQTSENLTKNNPKQ